MGRQQLGPHAAPGGEMKNGPPVLGTVTFRSFPDVVGQTYWVVTAALLRHALDRKAGDGTPYF